MVSPLMPETPRGTGKRPRHPPASSGSVQDRALTFDGERLVICGVLGTGGHPEGPWGLPLWTRPALKRGRGERGTGGREEGCGMFSRVGKGKEEADRLRVEKGLSNSRQSQPTPRRQRRKGRRATGSTLFSFRAFLVTSDTSKNLNDEVFSCGQDPVWGLPSSQSSSSRV